MTVLLNFQKSFQEETEQFPVNVIVLSTIHTLWHRNLFRRQSMNHDDDPSEPSI